MVKPLEIVVRGCRSCPYSDRMNACWHPGDHTAKSQHRDDAPDECPLRTQPVTVRLAVESSEAP